ncbi:hypothetical protein AW081_24040 [Escherichia coli]|nr:hypothetical protein AW081_24040 [Escherichia coli]
MRDKTREAMRFFLGGRCYTAENLEKDYLAEVANWGSAPISSKSLTLSIKTIIYHVVNRHIRTQYLRYHLVGLLPPKDCPNL